MVVMNAEARVMIVGSGGREQALAWKMAQSPQVSEVFVVSGNPGSNNLAERAQKPIVNIPLGNGSVTDIVEAVRRTGTQLVVVGPESLLERGLGDKLREAEISAVAPTQKMSRLETSKIFTRKLAWRWGIPQPEFVAFDVPWRGRQFIYQQQLTSGVIKADSLAQGKGVVVCHTQEELIEGIKSVRTRFPEAAKDFLIEELLVGREISAIYVTDGKNYISLPEARDYKREYAGDQGENTGGMGSYAPNEVVTPEVSEAIEQKILEPILAGMRSLGTGYQGILYLGIMLTADGPKLLEINCRPGDPETQTQLPLLNFDLYELFTQIGNGALTNPPQLVQNAKASVTVVLAAPEYPRGTSHGVEIYGLEQDCGDNVLIFQAGTKQDGDRIVTNGGRIFSVTAVADSLAAASEAAYAPLRNGQLGFEGMKFRTDIGRDLRRIRQ